MGFGFVSKHTGSALEWLLSLLIILGNHFYDKFFASMPLKMT